MTKGQWPNAPAVYEINTRVWLESLSRQLGRPITLANVPAEELDRIAAYRFDAVWLMGVWERSVAARAIALEDPDLRRAYRQALPDVEPEDVVASPFAVFQYRVDPILGGDAGLAELREQLARRGMRLILDYVPNHLAVDHPWVAEHPDRLVQGTAADLAREPRNYFRSDASNPPRVFAHGRDPYFPGWRDTVQLDYRCAETRQAMVDVLLDVATRCDGARCDMAMLVTRDVFLRSWGGTFDPPDAEFWPTAIQEVKALYPDFRFLAEVYWDLEYQLQQQGFDYTYDKRLYDRLIGGNASAIRAHLSADLGFQRRLARFVENHDEGRAAAVFGVPKGLAAATVALTVPGLRLFHEGQLAGWRIRLPVQLAHRVTEAGEPAVESFYRRLLETLSDPVFHDGQWRMLEPRPAWAGNPSHQQFVAHSWTHGDEFRLVAVNLAPYQAQCYVPLANPALAGKVWDLRDLLSDAHYTRQGDGLLAPGLYLDLPPHGYHIFRFLGQY